MAMLTGNTSTYKTYLMSSTDGSTYTKLADIKDYPDLGGTPEMLETTTLSDSVQTYIMGIQSADSMDFTMNYDPTVYKTLHDYQVNGTELYLAVYFGGTYDETTKKVVPDGNYGRFTFKGTLSVYATGGDVNAVREMTLSIARSTEITSDLTGGKD